MAVALALTLSSSKSVKRVPFPRVAHRRDVLFLGFTLMIISVKISGLCCAIRNRFQGINVAVIHIAEQISVICLDNSYFVPLQQ